MNATKTQKSLVIILAILMILVGISNITKSDLLSPFSTSPINIVIPVIFVGVLAYLLKTKKLDN